MLQTFISLDPHVPPCTCTVHVLMRDEKEVRKKQARSNMCVVFSMTILHNAWLDMTLTGKYTYAYMYVLTIGFTLILYNTCS